MKNIFSLCLFFVVGTFANILFAQNQLLDSLQCKPLHDKVCVGGFYEAQICFGESCDMKLWTAFVDGKQLTLDANNAHWVKIPASKKGKKTFVLNMQILNPAIGELVKVTKKINYTVLPKRACASK